MSSLEDRIAVVLHQFVCGCDGTDDETSTDPDHPNTVLAAASVVAELGLTQEWGYTGTFRDQPDLRDASESMEGGGVCLMDDEATARGWAANYPGSYVCARIAAGPWRTAEEGQT